MAVIEAKTDLIQIGGECEMKKTLKKVRHITVGEFVAELIEPEAKRMPPSYKDEADSLRRIAKFHREIGSSKTIIVREWERSE